MKIIKPLQLSLLYKVYEEESRYKLVTSVISFFSFGSQKKVLSEIDLWKFIPEELGQDAALDLAMPKPNGEVLLSAKFFAPDGEEVQAGKTTLQLGSINKTLHVFGDRYWQRVEADRWILTEPNTLKTIDISYTNSFGGEDFANNPLGKGYIKSLADTTEDFFPVANIMSPEFPIGRPDDTVTNPAGLGPYDLIWPQRYSKVGTYDEEWLNTRFPGFAKDFDPAFFNTAPEDQQIHGFFQGDETFFCENLHPEKSKIHSQLPGIRPRCFIHQPTKQDYSFKEIPLHLDTIWLFPHVEKGILIHRGTTTVVDDIASDVSEILLAHEHLNDPLRDLNHYRIALDKRLDEEKGYLYSLNEKDLIPDGAKSIMQELISSGEDAMGEGILEKNIQKKAALQLESAREQIRLMGLDPDDILDPLPSETTDIGFDNIEELDIITTKMMEDAKNKQEEMKKKGRQLSESMGLDFDKLLQDAESIPQKRIRFSATETIDKLRQIGLDNPEMEKKIIEAENQIDTVYREFGHHFPPVSLPEDDERNQLRATIIEGYNNGTTLSGKDFTGVDLSGLILKGIDLHGAFLEGADLTNTDLSNADLRDCVLVRSKLSQTIFCNSEMDGVNLGQADLTGSNFSEANLGNAVFYQAKLANACFKDAKMIGADLSECKGKKANMYGADLSNARFIESELDCADFSDCNLTEALFLNTSAKRINFTGAQLVATILVQFEGDESVFTNSDLTNLSAAMAVTLRNANFHGANLLNANLRGADLWGSNFENADLSGADLSECNLENSRFYRAVAKQTMFMSAILNNANMISINLYEGSLQKAQLENTDLRGANLFAADLLQADFSNARLEEANVQKTILSKWSAS